MRNLILMRHAKTEARTPGGDHARQLAPRGWSDCALIGQYLQSKALAPDRVLSSDATRTRETVEAIRPLLPPGCQTDFSNDLYLAEPEEILQEIRTVPSDTRTLLVVGHNPGMHMLAFSLGSRAKRSQRSYIAGHFPTAATAVFSCATNDWAAFAPGEGRLEHFVTAKSLRPAATGDDDDGD